MRLLVYAGSIHWRWSHERALRTKPHSFSPFFFCFYPSTSFLLLQRPQRRFEPSSIFRCDRSRRYRDLTTPPKGREKKTSIKEIGGIFFSFFFPFFLIFRNCGRKWMVLKLKIFDTPFISFSPSLTLSLSRLRRPWRLITRTSRRERNRNNVSHGRIGACEFNSGFVCTAREMEDTEMSRRKKDASRTQWQRRSSRLLRWRLTTPAASAGVSLAVCLFYEARLKNDSPSPAVRCP